MSRTEVLTKTMPNLFRTEVVKETVTHFIWNRSFKGRCNNFFRTDVCEYNVTHFVLHTRREATHFLQTEVMKEKEAHCFVEQK